jgi:hypothetical protein
LPLPRKAGIGFILSKIDKDGNEIPEEDLRKAMIEISGMRGGSIALEAGEGGYINKEGLKKTETILICYVITSRQPSVLERDLPNYSASLKDDLIKKKS